MTITTQALSKLQYSIEQTLVKISASQTYQALQAMTPSKRWTTLGLYFLASQLIIFGLLYALFGKVVVIGFFLA